MSFFFLMINVNASLLLLDGVAADDSVEAFFWVHVDQSLLKCEARACKMGRLISVSHNSNPFLANVRLRVSVVR